MRRKQAKNADAAATVVNHFSNNLQKYLQVSVVLDDSGENVLAMNVDLMSNSLQTFISIGFGFSFQDRSTLLLHMFSRDCGFWSRITFLHCIFTF